MQQEEYKKNGVRYVRIDKRKARIKFNDGRQIFLIQDLMRLDNAWQSPCPIQKSLKIFDFDKIVNDFQHYNCNTEQGRGVKYFINEEEL